MPNNFEKKVIVLSDTNFIFTVNFLGNPEKDSFGSTVRKANIIIPTKEQADELVARGLNVKVTRPREDDDAYTPEYFIQVILNFDSYRPPKVFIVEEGHNPVRLDENTIGQIDDAAESASIKKVNAVCNMYEKPGKPTTLYIQTMYVEINTDLDPFASRYIVD